MVKREGYVRWFSELGKGDVPLVGLKGANLAELYNNKFPTPPGFIVTSLACLDFIRESGISGRISDILRGTEIENEEDLNEASLKIRSLIENSKLSKEMEQEILEAYEVLDVDRRAIDSAVGGALDILRNSHEPPFVAVRSSIISSNFEKSSFAGQQESFLNVKGRDELLQRIKQCFASLYSARAIYYRYKHGMNYDKAELAIIIQKMVDAKKFGIVFSKNPMKRDGGMIIEAGFGLGLGYNSGKVNPDNYHLNYEMEIVGHKIRDKQIAVIRNSSGILSEQKLNDELSRQQALNGHELKRLAQIARRLEEHFKSPQDIEFAIDEEGISILQARPITTEFFSEGGELAGNVLISGTPVSSGSISGSVRFVRKKEDLSKIRHGDIIISEAITPDMFTALQRASGAITNRGGYNGAAAILARERKIPFVVSDEDVINKFSEGQVVTVDGNTGRVIEGQGIEKKYQINPVVNTSTKIRIILDFPDYADRAALSNSKSVGLARVERIISNSGKHPTWYLKNHKNAELIEFLQAGMQKILLPFDEAWFRLSDFRSDELKNLEGADEKVELNPLMGHHGIRFSLRNQDFLEAELSAIKELADSHQNKVCGILVPHLSSIKELREFKRLVEKVHLPRNVKLGVMIETPASVQIINEICDFGVDFVNIGLDELIQYTMVVDRNNPELKDLYDDVDSAIINSLRYVLKRCRRYGVQTSISGDSVRNEEIIRLGLEEKVGSFSVSANYAEEVSKIVSKIESERGLRSTSYSEGYEGAINPERILESEVVRLFDGKPPEMPKEMEMPRMEEKVKKSELDEESLILKALDDAGFEEESDYRPSFGTSNNKDIPVLNEAIPVESEHFEEEKVEDTFDLDKRMEEEAIKSIRGSSREMPSRKDEESDEDKVSRGADDELDNHEDLDSMLSGSDEHIDSVEPEEDETLDIF